MLKILDSPENEQKPGMVAKEKVDGSGADSAFCELGQCRKIDSKRNRALTIASIRKDMAAILPIARETQAHPDIHKHTPWCY